MRENTAAMSSSHSKLPPTLPTVVDEASDTPNWVPALGFGLFALIAIVLAMQSAWSDAHPARPEAAPVAAVAAGVPAATP